MRKKYLSFFKINLVLGLVYGFAGVLVLELMVQPSLAITVWPAAGMGIAACLIWGSKAVPGVIFGELLYMYYVSRLVEWPEENQPVFLIVAMLLIGVFRAWFGAFLIKRFVGSHPELIRLREILLFFLTIALTLVVTTTIFIGLLLYSDHISQKSLVLMYLSWLSGDLVGVFLFLPLTMMFFAKPRKSWRSRIRFTALPLAIAFFATIVLFNAIRTREAQHIKQKMYFHAHMIEQLFLKNSPGFNAVRPELSQFLVSTRWKDLGVSITRPNDSGDVDELFEYNLISPAYGSAVSVPVYFEKEGSAYLKVVPQSQYIDTHYAWGSWLIVISGTIFMAIFSMGLLALTGRTTLTEMEVRRRTKQLDSANQKLAKSNQNYQSMIENQPVIFWRVDLEKDRFTYVSKEAKSILGYSVEQWLTDDDFFINHLHPDDVAYVQSVVENMPQEKEKVEIEYRMISSSGEVKWFRDVLNISMEKVSAKECVGMMIDITEKKNTELKIRQLAYQDYLTGLPNRRHFHERLKILVAKAKERNTYGALLFLDMDRFKVLNDSLGHNYGDRLLVQTADRLRAFKDRVAMIARFGGDEFVIITTANYIDLNMLEKDILQLAEEIKNSLSKEFQMNQYSHKCTVSIGISYYPEKGKPYSDVIKQADAAMYRSKEKGKDQITVFEKSMRHDDDHKLRLEQSLRNALQNKEFTMVYQPIVGIDKKVMCYESLIRWHAVTHDYLPDEFIPVAEETGLIYQIGLWTLKEACRNISENSQTVTVNLSSKQFHESEVIEHIQLFLHQYEVDGRLLILELTESVAVYDIDETVLKMEKLKAMGIRLAIDDFGTGYSSLEYLRRMPIDLVKIDKSFIQDLGQEKNAGAIVEAIIAMANHLELTVIAEGVETQQQFELLEQYGCQYFQGYWFSQPLESISGSLDYA